MCRGEFVRENTGCANDRMGPKMYWTPLIRRKPATSGQQLGEYFLDRIIYFDIKLLKTGSEMAGMASPIKK
jgi:hypothetical protein